jgi:hypothetical protein
LCSRETKAVPEIDAPNRSATTRIRIYTVFSMTGCTWFGISHVTILTNWIESSNDAKRMGKKAS